MNEIICCFEKQNFNKKMLFSNPNPLFGDAIFRWRLKSHKKFLRLFVVFIMNKNLFENL